MPQLSYKFQFDVKLYFSFLGSLFFTRLSFVRQASKAAKWLPEGIPGGWPEEIALPVLEIVLRRQALSPSPR